jgi:hypothetical protein
MTKTAEELINSSAFWKMRMEQQFQYMTNFRWGTRPDAGDVFDSAMYIYDQCLFWYLGCRIIEECDGVIPKGKIILMLADHKNNFNEIKKHYHDLLPVNQRPNPIQ